MEKKFVLSALIGGLIVAVVGGVILYSVSAPQQLAGDFPGGVQPSQLWSGSAATNSVTPISGLPNLALTGNATILGSLAVGGTAVTNQIALIGVGTSTLNSTTFGPVGSTTSTATSTIPVNVGGFSVGDYCEISLTTVPTTTQFTAKGYVVVAGSATSSVIASYGNGFNGIVTVATGTFHAECHHYAI
jgi:hypothetical protein